MNKHIYRKRDDRETQYCKYILKFKYTRRDTSDRGREASEIVISAYMDQA